MPALDKYQLPARIYDGDIVTAGRYSFRVNFRDDTDSDAPWDNSHGHGDVRRSRVRHGYCDSTDKKPGERPMNSRERREYQFYYDWQGACQKARTEGWNAEPYDAPNRIARAVQADFDFLAGYVNGDWQYVGVIVTMLDARGNDTDTSDSLWCVETWKDYHMETARDMVRAMIEAETLDFVQRMQQARKEKRERDYWASRDVATV